MRLQPAIDLIGGRTVRLRKGDYGEEIEYEASPSEAARAFVEAGAAELHVVDLDGARNGRPEQLDVVAEIRGSVDVPIELGGGLRSLDDIRSAAAVGVDRFVLGTAAIEDLGFAASAVAEFGERIVVSVDARNGAVATDGWTAESGEMVSSLLERLAGAGVTRFVYSAIERDGMLSGPATDEVRAVASGIKGEFSYAGGISSTDDLAELASLGIPNLVGVIVGRALHEGRFTIAQGIAALTR